MDTFLNVNFNVIFLLLVLTIVVDVAKIVRMIKPCQRCCWSQGHGRHNNNEDMKTDFVKSSHPTVALVSHYMLYLSINLSYSIDMYFHRNFLQQKRDTMEDMLCVDCDKKSSRLKLTIDKKSSFLEIPGTVLSLF